MDYLDLALTKAGNNHERADWPREEESVLSGPLHDLMFLHMLTLHGFKGSDRGECYSAAMRRD